MIPQKKPLCQRCGKRYNVGERYRWLNTEYCRDCVFDIGWETIANLPLGEQRDKILRERGII